MVKRALLAGEEDDPFALWMQALLEFEKGT